MKMTLFLVRLYEQIPEPKYVISMGVTVITGNIDIPTQIEGGYRCYNKIS